MLNLDVDWSKVLIPLITAGVTALGTWLLTSGRRAIRNYGKTDVEVAMDDLEQALGDMKAAKETPDPSDDVEAKKKVDAARAHLAASKRLKGILDAFGDDAGDSE